MQPICDEWRVVGGTIADADGYVLFTRCVLTAQMHARTFSRLFHGRHLTLLVLLQPSRLSPQTTRTLTLSMNARRLCLSPCSQPLHHRHPLQSRNKELRSKLPAPFARLRGVRQLGSAGSKMKGGSALSCGDNLGIDETVDEEAVAAKAQNGGLFGIMCVVGKS